MRALQQRLPGAFQAGAQGLLAGLKQGLTVSQAMGLNPQLFSALEVSLVEVGETTGRRDTVYKALRDWFQLVWRLRSRVISALLYPAFVYHAAAVLIPFITIFTEGVSIPAAAVRALCLLAAPWAILVCVRLGAPALGALPGVGAALLAVPVLGGVLFRLDCTRFFTSLSLCLRAGLGSAAATAISAATCRNPALRARFAAVGRTMATEACSFTDALGRTPLSLDREAMIMELMRTGETTGKTEEAAEHIAGVCREEAEARMTQVAILAPNIAYLFLAAYIGYKIISFYGRVMLDPIREQLQ